MATPALEPAPPLNKPFQNAKKRSPPGCYGPRGASQYDRLNRAILKDRTAALQSASWGLGQIMGMNFVTRAFGTRKRWLQQCRTRRIDN
jgi:hypothetical protein